ncbi:hypothetical protein PHIM7_159 [Sinorhizobium phage phiM7]|uniref:Uncharacterized protein n=3 Tax=Emdodecavirus TaxID=1980937 RepID=S5M718_9CAUD|nr:hypothetical protein AB690_gp339 [Sinorhizobium phage phiM12]YP_009212411.1 hypothetical protein AVT40_gp362 [Sinorhizobium phage phiN3]YP_009601284.1 hypothetical protein FDH46_gp319 [Sinorhizobium phage phiM7]AKF13064.1 hypothetical protein PHIM19_159 [Sinorhizobium phage phiM19]AGR47861.1 hypothetical protein SmphiM12_229 [Sinorhizobium phage phiM12]AKF12705.1 hypothetical protein PHIM7_159 [Sinorhizobium phage phiM7]AKF13434.1 hypothetical protein PHIN3_171 [Sinorhizobium phage phiN3]
MSVEILTRLVLGYKVPDDLIEYATEMDDELYGKEGTPDVILDGMTGEYAYVGVSLASVHHDNGPEEIDFRSFNAAHTAELIRKYLPELGDVTEDDIQLYIFPEWF